MKTITAALISIGFLLAGGNVLAQDAMKKDHTASMAKDGMKKHAAKTHTIAKDGMNKDAMGKKDAMDKGEMMKK